jgi:acyl carrier protein
MDHAEIVSALVTFFEKEAGLDDANVLSDNSDLIDAGVISSLVLVTLVAYCEERFGCAVELDEITEDNFRSLDSIATYIAAKTTQAKPQ